MKKTHILITAAAIIAGLLAGGLPLRAQQHELDCFISDPDVDGMTNNRRADSGTLCHGSLLVNPNSSLFIYASAPDNPLINVLEFVHVNCYNIDIELDNNSLREHASASALRWGAFSCSRVGPAARRWGRSDFSPDTFPIK